MAEIRVINEASELITKSTLLNDLAAIGVGPGATLLVHTSMSKMGWIAGGAHTVVEALLEATTPEGTLMVPTQTGHLSDPAEWNSPPVPRAWWDRIRAETPAFDPLKTPSRRMGAISELLRTWPGALRSHHPHASFAAVGKHAGKLAAQHRLDRQLGDESPLGTLYKLDGQVLLMGPGWGNCTAFHLAEYRQPDPPMKKFGAAVIADGVQCWTEYQDVDIEDDDFPEIGADFEAGGGTTIGQIGTAESRLFGVRNAVDFATAWIPRNREKADREVQ